jgi:hypothetical protein
VDAVSTKSVLIRKGAKNVTLPIQMIYLQRGPKMSQTMPQSRDQNNERKITSTIPPAPEENEQPASIQLTVMLVVNGEVKETVVEVVDPSSGVMTVINSIVTTDLLNKLQGTNRETSIEYVLVATSTGTNSTT